MRFGWTSWLSILGLCACASKGPGWEATRATGTAEAYEMFLFNRPQSAHAPEARRALDELLWNEARGAEGYRAYLSRFPEGEHAKDARRRLGLPEPTSVPSPAKTVDKKSPPPRKSDRDIYEEAKTADELWGYIRQSKLGFVAGAYAKQAEDRLEQLVKGRPIPDAEVAKVRATFETLAAPYTLREIHTVCMEPLPAMGKEVFGITGGTEGGEPRTLLQIRGAPAIAERARAQPGGERSTVLRMRLGDQVLVQHSTGEASIADLLDGFEDRPIQSVFALGHARRSFDDGIGFDEIVTFESGKEARRFIRLRRSWYEIDP